MKSFYFSKVRNAYTKFVSYFGALGVSILVKLFGFTSQVYVASFLGVSHLSDAYFMSLIVPVFICNLFGGVIGLTTSKILMKKDSDAPRNIVWLGIVTIIVITLFFAYFTNNFYSFSKTTRLDANAIEVFKFIIYFMWPISALMAMSQMMVVWLNAVGIQIRLAITPLFYSACMLFFLSLHTSIFSLVLAQAIAATIATYKYYTTLKNDLR